METGEEKSGNLKRQRDPLSDSDDNSQPTSEMTDGQKRRRVEAAGRENHSPNRSTAQTKPDTPIVPSVRSRVQQLSQRRDGAAPAALRSLSNPGSDDRGFKEHLLGEREFNQRLERFKVPVFPGSTSSTPSPSKACPLTRSDFVSVIQEKLKETTTPSSKQASRLRQEREQELSQLQFQPISENAWLKRSGSDLSLSLGRSSAGSSSSSSQVPASLSKRKAHWRSTQPCEDGGDAERNDGSFTETLTPAAAVQTSGERSSSDAPTASAKLRISSGDDGEQEPQQAEITTTLKLCFNEEPSLSQPEQLTVLHQSNEETMKDDSRLDDQDSSDQFSLGENEHTGDSSYGEEAIEPSTDEEARIWRYPQFEEQEEGTKDQGKEEKREEDGSADVEMEDPSEIQTGETSGIRKEQPEEHLSAQQDNSENRGEQEVDELGSGGEQETQKPGGSEGEQVMEEAAGSGGEQEMEEPAGGGGEQDMEEPAGDEGVEWEVEEPEGGGGEQDDPSEIQIGETSGTRKDRPEEHLSAQQDNSENSGEQEVEELGGGGEQETQKPGGSEVEQAMEEPAEGGGREQEMEEPEAATAALGGGAEQGWISAERKQSVGERSKKITFILGGEQICSSRECVAETTLSDVELSTNEQNTSEIIDQMFGEVLEYAQQMEQEEQQQAEDQDSGIETFSAPKEKKNEEERQVVEEEENNGEELLTFPPSGILSPLSKSIEAAVTPLRLTVSQESSNPPSLLLSPEESTAPPPESAPLYSVDAYRTQRQKKPPSVQSVTPGAQRPTNKPQTNVNSKERIAALNEEAAKLQTVISQTLQALSCCTDKEHGRGSLEEAEAEKLLLVSCEKRSALLAEVSRLREERSSEGGGAAGEGGEGPDAPQQACRGTVSITNIQLPLKVEFVCSSHSRAGRPSHYFFILIRYGPCNVVATPLATTADAQNGDTISFPTSVILKDIRPSFEIDVEIYSLSNTSGNSCSIDRASTKSRVTPRKLLSSITRSSNTLTSAAPPALGTRRSSNFSLVGSHKITLASLGHSKFPLDKMKLEGKIRRLLGDEFQEKVPFLSPLEGNIYLQLDSKSHSSVQHQGFLTMFELVCGFGVWNRRYFVLEGCELTYWNHPNDRETKKAEGSLSLSSSPSQCVRTVQRDACARPFTFELVSSIQLQSEGGGSQDAPQKCWFSADTKQEKQDWMEKLSQALLDFHTWNRPQAEGPKSSSSGNLRESIL